VGGDRDSPGAGHAEHDAGVDQRHRQRHDLRRRRAVDDQTAAQQLQHVPVGDAGRRGGERRGRRERMDREEREHGDVEEDGEHADHRMCRHAARRRP
jgi:hypothetical protein